MMKKSNWIQIFLFCLFLAGFFVLNLCTPDRDFSEQENRYLQLRPKFSCRELFFGDYTSKFETYTTDQFPFRDSWISLKARSEILLGKKENNGVYLCPGNTLIKPFSEPDEQLLETNINAVNLLTEHAGCPVYLTLVPGASETWADKLPKNAPNASQTAVIDTVRARTEAQYIDLTDALAAHAEEPIYYRTDHHWTTLGAYYGYSALMQAMELQPLPLESFHRRIVSDSFCGTSWSSSGFSWVPPEQIETFVEETDAVHVTNYPSGKPVEGRMYHDEFLGQKDKYSYFWGGNTPLLQITTAHTDAPALLILRDSYMDCLSPFLTEHFSRIDILDLRYYRTSLQTYLQEHDFDAVLVCYSVSNFCTDSSVYLAGR
ncbi:MAG: DHHW family protein [Clostridiales bacterium]|nr:DHHW family protein [Clostridiales bacterium]